MWANAQHNGRPAEYRWRPLFNAAVWLTPTTTVPCSNASKTRNPLKFAGVSQTTGPISAASGPKFTILWGHVEEVLLLNYFFRLSIRALVVRWCADGNFWRFFASCICSEPCAASFRPASEIRTKATPCVEVWQTSNLRRLRLGEERKKKKERRNHRAKI